MVQFVDEAHGLSDPYSQIRAAQEQISWFRQYLGIEVPDVPVAGEPEEPAPGLAAPAPAAPAAPAVSEPVVVEPPQQQPAELPKELEVVGSFITGRMGGE
jgi:hypothetical protein